MRFVIIAVTVLALLLDIWLFADGVEGNTISQVMIDWAKDTPFIAFAWGFLMAHWWG